MKKLFFMMFWISSFCAAQEGGIYKYSALSDTLADTPGSANVSISYVDSVFRFIESQGYILDFEDCNTCKSRAHIMARVIEKNFPDAVVGKIWLVADCRRLSKFDEYKYKPHVLLEHKKFCNNWVYHVAPVIISVTDTFVIDPATQNAPVTLRKWASKLIPTGGSALVVIKRPEYFIYPESNELFEDELVNWSDTDDKILDTDYSRSIDEMTRAKLGLIEPWKMKNLKRELEELVR